MALTPRFGTSATVARAVVDAVIVAVRADDRQLQLRARHSTYSLIADHEPAGSGFGASAGSELSLGGKPIGGTIDDGRRQRQLPTPTTPTAGSWIRRRSNPANSTATSPTHSPATHQRAAPPRQGRFLHRRRRRDDALHGPVRQLAIMPGRATPPTPASPTPPRPARAIRRSPRVFYTFVGPSIKHLLTSNNGGRGGGELRSAVHGAGPETGGVEVSFGGDTYIGRKTKATPSTNSAGATWSTTRSR